MHSKRPLLFTALGALFLLAGLVTLLGVVTAWNLGTPIRLEFLGYAALNFLLSYGFFDMQRWLLPALAVNWLVGGALAAIKLFVIHSALPGSATAYAVSFCAGGLIFLAVYMLPRKKSSLSAYERPAAAAFLVIWAATTCYTMIGLLT